MDNDNVAIRLKGFIDSEGLSHSQFADKCGIPRPSLSQILSGRNKKISDVIIGQIHRAFPALSVLWLLFGEGEMTVAAGKAKDSFESGFSSDYEDGLFGNADLDFSDDESPECVSNSKSSAEGRNSMSDLGSQGFMEGEFARDRSGDLNFQNVKALTDPLKAVQRAEKQLLEAENRIAELQMQIEKLRQNPRKVSHITVYYDDSTFETFYSQP